MNTEFKAGEIKVIKLDVTGPAEYGWDVFTAAIIAQNCSLDYVNHWNDDITLVVGTTGNRRIQILLENEDVDYRLEPESLFVQWCTLKEGRRALLIAGVDETGLMYNLLEMARRIEANGIEALDKAENLVETPYNKVRCMDRYVVGHLDDEWLKSDEFWQYYMARLAKNRFNRFCLIIGFDTAYMSPPYPFFMKSKKYPQVYVEGMTEGMQAENLRMLRNIGDICHKHGIKFVLATWQQRPWNETQDDILKNLPEEVTELGEYCYDGIKELLRAVPEIDIVQFRVNHESGVGDQVSAADFWNHCVDAVAEVTQETGRPLIMDLRAKGLTDPMIDHAFNQGLPVEVPTKYWCEHAALPYHLSIMRTEELVQLENFNHSRRYSYGDMLQKPKYYDVIYRLWNYGSTNLFLWGDADYGRRFSLSCGLSGSTGYEVNSPLSLKYGHESHHIEHWDTFINPALKGDKWEDERFWMWYIVYGRLGYNPDTDSSVWMDEYKRRFGEKGPALEKALAAASKIVPMVTTIHMPIHPSLAYWIEMNTGWSLFFENSIYASSHYDNRLKVTYGSSEPSDHGLFYGVDEYAADLVSGRHQGKYTPLQTSKWLKALACETADRMAEADVCSAAEPEVLAMKVDMEMLQHFACYHADKMLAAYALEMWRQTKDKSYLSDAKLHLSSARKSWDSLSEMGREHYYHDLNFGSAGSKNRRGTWGDLTRELEADRVSMDELIEIEAAPVSAEFAHCYAPKELPQYQMEADFPDCTCAGEDLEIKVYCSSMHSLKNNPVLHYRHTDQTEGVFREITMTEGDGFTAVIPGSYLSGDFDLQVYVTVCGGDGSCAMFPGVYNPIYPYPYHVITVDRRG